MSATIEALRLPQNGSTPRKVRMVALAAALMVAGGLSAYLTLRSDSPANPARAAVQGQRAPQALSGYQSWIRARDSAVRPAIVRPGSKASTVGASASWAHSWAKRHHKAIAGRSDLTPAISAPTHPDARLCPLGRRGSC